MRHFSIHGKLCFTSICISSFTSQYASQSVNSLYASSSVTSSYSRTASYIGQGSDNYFPKWSLNTLSTSSILQDNGTGLYITGSLTSSQNANINNIVIGNDSTGFRESIYSTKYNLPTSPLRAFTLGYGPNPTSGGQITIYPFSSSVSSSIVLLYGRNKDTGLTANNRLLLDGTTNTAYFGDDQLIPTGEFIVQTSGSVGPISSSLFDLGSPTNFWRKIYVAEITASRFSGSFYGTTTQAISCSWASASVIAFTANYASQSVNSVYASSSIVSNSSLIASSSLFTSSSLSSSWASSSVFSVRSFYASSSLSSSWASSSFYSNNSLFASASLSSSWASSSLSSSYASSSFSASYSLTSSYASTCSYYFYGVVNVTQSYITVAGFASASLSASYASGSGVSYSSLYSSQSFTSNYASQSVNSLYASSSNVAFTSTWASSSVVGLSTKIASSSIYSSQSVVAFTANYASQSQWSVSSSFASSSVTSSYSATASYIGYGVNNYFPFWINNTLSTSSILQLTSSYPTAGEYLKIGPSDTYGSYLLVGGTAINRLPVTSSRISTAVNDLYLDSSGSDSAIYLNFWGTGNVITNVNGGKVGINTSTLTNQLTVNGNVWADSYTGSLRGTASWARSSSYATTASYAMTSSISYIAYNALSALSASWASASFSSFSSSYALTASYAYTASYVFTSSYTLTASYISGATLGQYYIQDGNSFGNLATLGTNDNYDLAIETNGVEKIRVKNTGQVGIGTDTPQALLHVFGNISASSITASHLGNTIGTASWALNSLVSQNSFYASSSNVSLASNYASSSDVATSAVWASSSVVGLSTKIASSSIYASQSVVAFTTNYASQSVTGLYASGSNVSFTTTWASSSVVNLSSRIASSSIFASSSVVATSAIYASGSTSTLSSSWSSASYSNTIFTTSSNVPQYLVFVSNTGSNLPLYVTTSFLVNPILGSFTAVSFTGSFLGTSSWATNALSTSYFSGSITGLVPSASYATSASWAPSFALVSGSIYPITASWALNSLVSQNSFYASSSNVSFTTTWASSSVVGLSTKIASSSIYASSSVVAFTSTWASSSVVGLSTKIASSSIYASSSVVSTYAGWASSSLTASYFGSGVNNYVPIWQSNLLSPSSSIFINNSLVGISTATPSSSLDVYGQTRDINGNISENYTPYSNWTKGSGSTDLVGGFYFSENINPASSASNTRDYGVDPYGRRTLLWIARCTDVVGSGKGGTGGWNTPSFTINPKKSYRYSVWFKKSSLGDLASGNFYLGCDTSGNTQKLDGVVESNPYFLTVNHVSFAPDKWYLAVGYLWASDSTGSYLNTSKIYDETGSVFAAGSEFKQTPNTNYQSMRVYSYYNGVNNSYVYYWGPKVEEINGREATIGSLIPSASMMSSYVAGTANYVAKFTSTSTIGNSVIYDNGNVGISTTTTTGIKLNVWSDQGSTDNAAARFLYQIPGQLGEVGILQHTSARSIGWSNLYISASGASIAYAAYIEGNKTVAMVGGMNVGIGVTGPVGVFGASPTNCLDVLGDIRCRSHFEVDQYVLQNGYYDGSNWRYRNSQAFTLLGNGISARVWSVLLASPGTAGNIASYTYPFNICTDAPNSSFWISGSTGLVGIGTSNPQTLLHVFGQVSASSFVGSFLGMSLYASQSVNSLYASSSNVAFTATWASSSVVGLSSKIASSSIYASSSVVAFGSNYASQSVTGLYASSSNVSFTSTWASSSVVGLFTKIASSSIYASSSVVSTYAGWASSSLTASYIGSGTNNYLPKWSSNTLTGTSNVYDNATSVGIGSTLAHAQSKFHVFGTTAISNFELSSSHVNFSNYAYGGLVLSWPLAGTYPGFAICGGIRVNNVLASVLSFHTVTNADIALTQSIGASIRPISDNSTAGNYGMHLAFYTRNSSTGNSVGDLERMRILNDGTVGIGTTTSTGKFSVFNNANSGNGGPPTGALANAGLVVGGTNTTGILAAGINATGTFYSWLQSTSTTTAAQYNLVLQPDGGNVGIGTATPTGGRLEVCKSSTYNNEAEGGISVLSVGGNTKLLLGAVINTFSYVQSMENGVSWATRPLSLQPNGGYVGVGVTNPTYTLQVNGTFYLQGVSNVNYMDGTFRWGAGNTYSSYLNSNGTAVISSSAGTIPLKAEVNDSAANQIVGMFAKSPVGNRYYSTILRVARDTGATDVGWGTGTQYEYTDIEYNSIGSGGFRFGTTYGDSVIACGYGTKAGPYGSIQLCTSGSTRMTIGGGTLAGYVGIGITNPAYPLQVRRVGGAGSLGINIDNVVGSNRDIKFECIPDSAADSGGFAFYTKVGAGANLAMYMTPAALIGIGTAAPENGNGWAKVVGSYAAGNNRMYVATATVRTVMSVHDSGFFSGLAGGIYGTETNHGINFITNGATRMVIDNAGLVGIGTISPSALLHISASTSVAQVMVLDTANPGGPYITFIARGSAYGYIGGNTGVLTGTVSGGISIRSQGNFYIGTNGDSTKVTVLTTGEVGIGSTAPGQKLDVSGSIRLRGGTYSGSIEFTDNTPTPKWRIDIDMTGNSMDFNYVG
jgi:hypothetical protein